MTKPVPPTGTKRICPSCASKFYDLNKRPIVCPKCKTELASAAAAIIS